MGNFFMRLSRIGIDMDGGGVRSNALVLGYRVPVVKGHGTASGNAVYHGICRLADCDKGFSGERILNRVGKYFL